MLALAFCPICEIHHSNEKAIPGWTYAKFMCWLILCFISLTYIFSLNCIFRLVLPTNCCSNLTVAVKFTRLFILNTVECHLCCLTRSEWHWDWWHHWACSSSRTLEIQVACDSFTLMLVWHVIIMIIVILLRCSCRRNTVYAQMPKIFNIIMHL